VTANVLSIVLFLAFALAGLQKIVAHQMMTSAPEHIGSSTTGYERVGVIEVAGAVGLISGVVANRSTFLSAPNVASVAGLGLAKILAVYFHVLRETEPWNSRSCCYSASSRCSNWSFISASSLRQSRVLELVELRLGSYKVHY
jgi:hypothetical protein